MSRPLVLDALGGRADRTKTSDCSNYGAAGNASAFPNKAWDFYFPVLLLAWILAILMEQLLTPAHRGRSVRDILGRASVALTMAVMVSCCGVGPLMLLCH